MAEKLRYKVGKDKNNTTSIGSKERKLRLFGFLAFVLGFQGALAAYVNSSFLKQNSGLENVGIFYFIAYSGSLIVLFNVHSLVKKYGKAGTFLIFLILKSAALFGVFLFANNVLGTVLAVFFLFAGPLMWVGMDILVEDSSENRVTGSIRGKHLSIMNFGWFLAPFLASIIIGNFGFGAIYLVSSFLVTAVILILSRYTVFKKDGFQKNISIKRILKRIQGRPEISRIYYISFILEFFYAAMIIYSPLYLISQGFDWGQIGKIFTAMLVPFFVIQYPIGVLADKKSGEKEMIGLALAIMSASVFFLYFLPGAGIIYWVLVLVMTRIGAAVVEVLRDSYFYKQIGRRDVDLIDFFRTTRSLAFIAVSLIFGFLTFFISIRELMIFLSLFILTGLIPLWKLDDTN